MKTEALQELTFVIALGVSGHFLTCSRIVPAFLALLGPRRSLRAVWSAKLEGIAGAARSCSRAVRRAGLVARPGRTGSKHAGLRGHKTKRRI